MDSVCRKREEAMQSKRVTGEQEPCLPPPKDQWLRRVYSDLPTDTEKIKDRNLTMETNEVQMVECECCGMSEECTPTYIGRIKGFFCGKWICGLCSEAVKEQTRRNPGVAKEEALESHMALSKKFNRTVRLNPKLSLAGTMRDIARKSSQQRTSMGHCASKIPRNMSCGPRMNVRSNSHQSTETSSCHY